MPIKAQLFITCLAEQFFPGVLRRMVGLLERLGVEVAFPEEQTCCGQPFFNSGYQTQARELARKWLEVFGRTDGFIVSPSGSCVDMVRHHYPHLFSPGTPEHRLAEDTAARTFEFTQFLVQQLKVTDVGARFPHKATYHASCHLLRGLGVREEPKALLRKVQGLELVPLSSEETCCGFGGTFSVIYPEVSQAMMEAKVNSIEASGAEVVVACDAGSQVDSLGIGTMVLPDVCALECAGPGCCPISWANCSDAKANGMADPLMKRDHTLWKSFTRHLGGSNLGFMDGHASWMPAEALLTALDPHKNVPSGIAQYEMPVFEGKMRGPNEAWGPYTTPVTHQDWSSGCGVPPLN